MPLTWHSGCCCSKHPCCFSDSWTSARWQDLVNGLNAATAPGTYAFREVPGRSGNGVVGTDVISVKFLYKPATFEPVRLLVAICLSRMKRSYMAVNALPALASRLVRDV